MNRVILMGRLTRDPVVRYSQQPEGGISNARYTIAVDRNVSRNAASDQPTADFISCVAFGKTAEFVEKYLKKGTKIAIEGRIQTGSYQKDGQTIYTTDVVVDRHEFCESRNGGGDNAGGAGNTYEAPAAGSDPGADFMNVPDGIDESLPFK